tara:strand:- start:7829 stop:8353 length:525 start_codon:yes stop_codon:yes gene_type:complete
MQHRLSKREAEVYLLLGRGYNCQEISEKLELSDNTIFSYKENIKIKLDLNKPHEVVISAILCIYSHKLESPNDKVYFSRIPKSESLTCLSNLYFYNSFMLLSDRETEVYDLIGRGLKTGEVATKLCIDNATIDTHLDKIKTKLKLKSTTEVMFHSVLYHNKNYLRDQRNESFGF